MPDEDPPFGPTSDVFVIGGGPAGLHIAHRLQKAGYKKPVILEGEQRLGGKSHTKVFDAYPNVRHELGTCYMHLGYDRITYLLKHYGLGNEITTLGKAFTDAHKGFAVRRVWDLKNQDSDAQGEVDYERVDGKSLDFDVWVLTSAFQGKAHVPLDDFAAYKRLVTGSLEDVKSLLRDLVEAPDEFAAVSSAKGVNLTQVLHELNAPQPALNPENFDDAFGQLEEQVKTALAEDSQVVIPGERARAAVAADAHDGCSEFQREFKSADFGWYRNQKAWRILASACVFARAMQYCWLHTKTFKGLYAYGLPPQVDFDKAGLDCTFEQWLDKHGLQALKPFFIYSQAAQGYGAIQEVPAFYGLWWNSPNYILRTFLSQIRVKWTEDWLIPGGPASGKVEFGVDEDAQRLVRSGFSSLWENMAARDRLDVRLGCKVTHIERERDSDGKQTITYTRTEVVHHDDGERTFQEYPGQTLKADFVILTVPPPILLTAAPGDAPIEPVFEPTPEEAEIFSSMSACHFRVTAARIDEMPPTAPSHPGEVWLGPLARFDGHVRYISWSGLDLYAHTVEARPAVLTYQIMKQRPSKATTSKMQELWDDDVKKIGLGNPHVLYAKNWDYFWHFENDAIQKQYPWKLLELQGKHGMWFAGAAACFESVIDVLAYNDRLLYDKLGLETDWKPGDKFANFSGDTFAGESGSAAPADSAADATVGNIS